MWKHSKCIYELKSASSCYKLDVVSIHSSRLLWIADTMYYIGVEGVVQRFSGRFKSLQYYENYHILGFFKVIANYLIILELTKL